MFTETRLNTTCINYMIQDALGMYIVTENPLSTTGHINPVRLGCCGVINTMDPDSPIS